MSDNNNNGKPSHQILGVHPDELYEHFVTLREHDHLRDDIHSDLKEIKESILSLSQKVDHLSSSIIPELKTQTAVSSVAKLDTKQKVLWTGFISIVSLIITGMFAIAKGLLGIP